MKTLRDIAKQQQAARPAHDDPLTDALLAEIVRLAEEVCVLRDRLDTVSRLSAAGRPSDTQSIDAFEPEDAVIAARLSAHTAFFESIFERVNNRER